MVVLRTRACQSSNFILKKVIQWACVTGDMVCIWRPEDNFRELLLSFYHVGPRNQTQAIRLQGKQFYHVSHLAGPPIILNFHIILSDFGSFVFNTHFRICSRLSTLTSKYKLKSSFLRTSMESSLQWRPHVGDF